MFSGDSSLPRRVAIKTPNQFTIEAILECEGVLNCQKWSTLIQPTYHSSKMLLFLSYFLDH